jgi:hypothetical protein
MAVNWMEALNVAALVIGVGVPVSLLNRGTSILYFNPKILNRYGVPRFHRAACFDTTAIGKSTSASLLHSLGII